MAGRIRTIKPEILEDERTASLSSDAWRLYVSMWLLADDHGNLYAHPAQLGGSVFWACPNPVRADDLLEELATAGLIERYQVRGQRYAHISGWAKHQRVDNAGKPRVPGPEELAEVRGDSPQVAEVCRSTSDLRPPTATNDLDHDLPASPSAQSAPGPLKLTTSEKPAEKPRRRRVQKAPKIPDAVQEDAKRLCEHFQAAWVRAFMPADGAPPKVETPDFMRARDLAKRFGFASAQQLVDAYLADRDPFLIRNAHQLRHMKADAYRANSRARGDPSVGRAEAAPHNEKTEIVNDF